MSPDGHDPSHRGLRRAPRSRRIAEMSEEAQTSTRTGAGAGAAHIRAAAQRAHAHLPAPRFPLQPGAVPQRDAKPVGQPRRHGQPARHPGHRGARRRARRRAEGARAASRAAQRVPEQAGRGLGAPAHRDVNLLRLRADLVACGSNYLASLKDSEFLSAIKHRSAIPGRHLRVRPAGFLLLAQPGHRPARAFLQRVAGHAAPAVRCHRRAAVDHAAARQAAAGDRARRRVPHHLRTRHAHPAGAHRAAGGFGAVSGDLRRLTTGAACGCWPGTG